MFVSTSNIAGRDRAAAIKANANASMKNIRSDQSLSAEGKRERLAEIYRATQTQLAALKAEVERAPRERRDTLQKRLFGARGPVTGADAISYRDAYMRASQLTSEDEARELLEIAQASNDQVLADAVAQQAIKRSWIPTLESWSGGNQRLDDQLGELLQVNAELAEESWSTASVASALAKDLVFNAERPVEVDDNDLAVVDVASGAA